MAHTSTPPGRMSRTYQARLDLTPPQRVKVSQQKLPELVLALARDDLVLLGRLAGSPRGGVGPAGGQQGEVVLVGGCGCVVCCRG